MQIILLTHEREVDRSTNTGGLALELVPELCRRIIWSRVSPDVELVAKLASGEAKLLFPKQTQEYNLGPEVNSSEQENMGSIEANDGTAQLVTENALNDSEQALVAEELPEMLVILDGTWQEARKMYRQSPYLKQASTCYLEQEAKSNYQLRRNQLEGGLCTVECVMAILKLMGKMNLKRAELLETAYERHNQRLDVS